MSPATAEQISFANRLIDQFDVLRRSGVLAAAERLTSISPKLPSGLQPPTLGAASELSRLLTGPSTPTAFAEAQRISRRLGEIGSIGAMVTLPDPTRVAGIGRDLLNLSNRLTDATRFLVGIQLPWELERATELSTRAWRIVLGGLPESPTQAELVRASFAGVDTVATASATALLSDEDVDDVELLDPIAPTIALADESRAQLRARLAGLDANLPRRLQGAWESVSAGGADAASQAAHSLQELIDGSLRLAAPDDAVISWHKSSSRPEDELHGGKPTRVLRAKYLLRNRRHDQTAGRLYLRSLDDLCDALQGHKHRLHAADEQIISYLALTVEGCLGFLLHD